MLICCSSRHRHSTLPSFIVYRRAVYVTRCTSSPTPREPIATQRHKSSADEMCNSPSLAKRWKKIKVIAKNVKNQTSFSPRLTLTLKSNLLMLLDKSSGEKEKCQLLIRKYSLILLFD